MSLIPQIDLQPSPYDRLDPVARATRWWLGTLRSILSRSASPTRAPSAEASRSNNKQCPRDRLDEQNCFVAELTLPPGSPEAHRRAIELRLDELAPVDARTLSIAAVAIHADDTGGRYRIAMARDETLTEVAKRSGDGRLVHSGIFPGGVQSPILRSKQAIARRRWRKIMDSAFLVGLAVILAVATSIWTERIRRESQAIADREREIRRAKLVGAGERADAELVQALTAKGILERRPGGALHTLALLNAAMPDDAWWETVRWSPDEVMISARGSDATASLDLFSQNALRWSIELSGPITSADRDDAQSFDIRITPRRASADAP